MHFDHRQRFSRSGDTVGTYRNTMIKNDLFYIASSPEHLQSYSQKHLQYPFCVFVIVILSVSQSWYNDTIVVVAKNTLCLRMNILDDI
jgi:hypothetical protein